MSNAETSPRSRSGGRWFFLFGLLFLTALGWHFGFRDLGDLLRDAKPVPLALMSLLIVAGFWLRAAKWRYALGPGQQGILLFFLAKTAGNWTPGRAGELAPLLLKRHRNARVAAWIGLDRVVEVAWTLVLGLAGVAWLGLVAPWAWFAIVAGALVVALLTLTGLRVQSREETSVNDEVTGGWKDRILAFALKVRTELLLFSRKFPLVMALTFFAKLTDVYAVVYLCEAFGYTAGIMLVCAARCAHGLVSAIPVTPDATGVPYVAAAWFLYQYAGIPYETLTTALALEVIAINAILWVCFCLVTARRWKSPSIGSTAS
ncbi:MAG: flippase-like domain-containing protein [Candidatus Hydrogenedentes bacterium]|nr:flippase-like domain-containing protein [Candidatus Hydrogenedentota bacterium]